VFSLAYNSLEYGSVYFISVVHTGSLKMMLKCRDNMLTPLLSGHFLIVICTYASVCWKIKNGKFKRLHAIDELAFKSCLILQIVRHCKSILLHVLILADFKWEED